MNRQPISRRNFLIQAGVITIGFSLTSGCQSNGTDKPEENKTLPPGVEGQSRIDSWLQVLEDGRIRIFTGKMELGQGIRIAIAQVAAEELNTDPDLVEVHLAETDVTPDEGYTAGSRSIESSAMSVRFAAAAARKILMERASEKFNTDVEDLNIENGHIKIRNGNVAMTFSEILGGLQIVDEVKTPIELRLKEDYQWVGRPIPRKDISRMVRGEPVYVQDLQFPGMVHARIIRPPGYGRKLISYDESELRNQVDGILKLVVNGSFMGVIAEEEYYAVKAQAYLERHTRWSASDKLAAGKPFKEVIKTLSSETIPVEDKGKVVFSSDTLTASYYRPYTMHGSMGPSCSVAVFDGNELQVWSHTQGVYPLRRSLQGLLNLPIEKIRVTGIPGAGCYGHNGADDVAADAALLAMAYPNRHVRLQWSRADEHAWEPYGSAMVMEFEANLSTDGRISNWQYDVWSDAHSTRPGGNPGNLLPGWYLENPFEPPSGGYFGGASRNSVPYYTIPNLMVVGHSFRGPLRVSALRGLGGYANIFAIECFMDELSDKAGMDPLEFRLKHLEDPRARDVIEKIREMTQDQKMSEKEGIGYAFSRYKNQASYIAVAAKVSLMENDRPSIRKMWGVIDSGEVINPDGLKNQTEGGMLQSASWMMKEQVEFDEEQVISLDWYGYPILRYEEVPDLEVEVIDRPLEPPLGAGEAAQGPASAAIANGIYRASGKRIRDLPVTSHYNLRKPQ
jgi:nicotinate dehydrogenase subunit B